MTQWGPYFSENFFKIQTFSFKKMHLKISFAKWQPFCLGLNELMISKVIDALHQCHTLSYTDTCFTQSIYACRYPDNVDLITQLICRISWIAYQNPWWQFVCCDICGYTTPVAAIELWRITCHVLFHWLKLSSHNLTKSTLHTFRCNPNSNHFLLNDAFRLGYIHITLMCKPYDHHDAKP